MLAEHELISSALVIDELDKVLRDKLRMPKTRVNEVLRFVRDQALLAAPEAPASWPESDQDDRWIVAAALESDGDVLVTGDQEILDISERVSVDIGDPRRFWERLIK